MTKFLLHSTFFLILLFSSLYAETWSGQELEIIESLSLKERSFQPYDPSNKYLDNLAVISFGKILFNDTRLSSNKKVACRTCHLKENAFTDNKTVALGIRSGLRNTPTLLNVALHHWYFWDGSKDSLWAQALSSIENPAEHNFSRLQVFHLIATDSDYRKRYLHLFNHSLPQNEALLNYPKKAGPNAKLEHLIAWKNLSENKKHIINLAFTNIGKAIAAYISTLQSNPTRFDYFVQELINKGKSSLLSSSEKKGLKLFINKKSGCINCHRDALFSNKEFHNIGTGIPGRDNGRSEVVNTIIYDEYNCLGKYSDAKPNQCLELKFLNKDKHDLAGAFKTPTLRNISQTAPYMHDGRYHSLEEVLEHYTNMTKEQALETALPVIELNKEEQDDVVSFLLTL